MNSTAVLPADDNTPTMGSDSPDPSDNSPDSYLFDSIEYQSVAAVAKDITTSASQFFTKGSDERVELHNFCKRFEIQFAFAAAHFECLPFETIKPVFESLRARNPKFILPFETVFFKHPKRGNLECADEIWSDDRITEKNKFINRSFRADIFPGLFEQLCKLFKNDKVLRGYLNTQNYAALLVACIFATRLHDTLDGYRYLPTFLSFTARQYIRQQGPSFLTKYPWLEESMYGSLPTFREDEFNIKFYDPLFPTYDATFIPDINMVACGGPRSEGQLIAFFDNLFFNERCPIKNIIVAGNKFAPDIPKTVGNDYDFINYFLWPTGSQLIVGKYRVTIQQTDEFAHFLAPLTESCASDHTASTKVLLQITDTKSQKTNHISLYFFKLIDGNAFTPNSLDLALLTELVEISEKETIAAHCLAGMGRSVHFLLAIALAKKGDILFAPALSIATSAILKKHDSTDTLNNPSEVLMTESTHFSEETGKKIIEILSMIRQRRPASIFSDAQFTHAIYNALYLYQLKLQKHRKSLLQSHQEEFLSPTSNSAHTLFSPRQKNPVLIENYVRPEAPRS